jgi:alkylation response protein AidB-like acyl-CoA dehydrogenase
MPVIAPDDVVADAAHVADLARSNADLLATSDHLPTDIVDAARTAGLFRMCLASELGGLRVPLPTAVSIIENLSYADGSLGWCVATANVAASRLVTLDEAAARIIAAEPEQLIIAGSFPPHGTGRRTDDGYELSVRSTFASGCIAATWFVVGMMVEQADGAPVPMIAYFPADQGKIVPNWDVIGLRATGSHDVVAEGVVVPASCTVPLFGGRSWSTDPITMTSFAGIVSLAATVPLGIARHALDELARVAATKTPTGQQQTLINDPSFQGRLATATGRLRAARGFVLDAADVVWQQANEGAVTMDARANLMLAMGESGEAALAAAQFAHQAVGTTSIRTDSMLTRCMNDVFVVTRHVGFSESTRQVAGRISLGLPANSPFFED